MTLSNEELLQLYPNSWRAKQALAPKLPPLLDDKKNVEFYYYFNPECKHERCAYDLMTCDACIAHSRRIHKLRVGAKNSIDATNNNA